MAGKNTIADIDRSIYDFRYEETDKEFYRIEDGLTKEIIEKGKGKCRVNFVSRRTTDNFELVKSALDNARYFFIIK